MLVPPSNALPVTTKSARRAALYAGPAPPPDAAAAAEPARDDRPARDVPRGDLDANQLADHRPVAVGAGADVDRASDERQRAPHELRRRVVVDAHGPTRAVAAGDEIERVQQPEPVRDIEGTRTRDRRRACPRRPSRQAGRRSWEARRACAASARSRSARRRSRVRRWWRRRPSPVRRPARCGRRAAAPSPCRPSHGTTSDAATADRPASPPTRSSRRRCRT